MAACPAVAAVDSHASGRRQVLPARELDLTLANRGKYLAGHRLVITGRGGYERSENVHETLRGRGRGPSGDADLPAFQELARTRRPELRVSVARPGLSKGVPEVVSCSYWAQLTYTLPRSLRRI